MGAIIGDALGVGPHWYYDLDELKAEYGDWIDTYMPPKPNPHFPAIWKARHGLKPGDVSQTGQVFILLLESVSEWGDYDEADFTERLDGLLSTLDGTASGGRYTDEAMRDVWHLRQKGVLWPFAGSFKDTAEAAIRIPIISALYANSRDLAFESIISNVALTHCDPVVLGQSTAFGMHIWMLINDIPLSEAGTFTREFRKVKEFSIPFSAAINWKRTEGEEPNMHEISFVDPMGRPTSLYAAAKDPEIKIEPALAACRLFTLNCRISHLLPAAYFLASRFENDFEMAVLSAINAGGNNMARAALTGALSGAMVGYSGIPERWVTGLVDHERLLDLADRVVAAAKVTGLR
jgi:ADP-ribosylglycohydrolase